VLTQDDVNAVDARMAKINAHIRAKADEPGAGYAYFSLDALYALPKPRFSVRGLLLSSAPFGPNISLDGLHPSASGQGILAAAAARAIAARYGLAIP
jgi:lysophospholipase L1-like esterase